jgi:hypothetical protein
LNSVAKAETGGSRTAREDHEAEQGIVSRASALLSDGTPTEEETVEKLVAA